jgi:hypothetical protein
MGATHSNSPARPYTHPSLLPKSSQAVVDSDRAGRGDKMRPRVPDRRQHSDHTHHGTNAESNATYQKPTPPVIAPSMGPRKKKSIANLFGFGKRRKKSAVTKLDGASVVPDGTALPIIVENPVLNGGSMHDVGPSPTPVEPVDGAPQLWEDMWDGLGTEGQKRPAVNRNSVSSDSTSYRTTLSLFDSAPQWQSQGTSLTTSTPTSGYTEPPNTLIYGMTDTNQVWESTSTTRLGWPLHNSIPPPQPPTLPTLQFAIQGDQPVDSNISSPAINKGKAVASDTSPPVRKWSWDERDIESENRLSQPDLLSSWLPNGHNFPSPYPKLAPLDPPVSTLNDKQSSPPQPPNSATGKDSFGWGYTECMVPLWAHNYYSPPLPPQLPPVTPPTPGPSTTYIKRTPHKRPRKDIQLSLDLSKKWLHGELGPETAEQVEQDRLLAEALQRMEDATIYPPLSTTDNIEEVIRKLDEEEDVIRRQELDLIAMEDEQLAYQIAEQEREEFEEQQRQERARLEEEERRRKQEEEERRNLGFQLVPKKVEKRGIGNALVLREAGDPVWENRPDMQELLQTVKKMFSEGLPDYAIWKVDVILNPKLEKMYEETKATFQKMGRGTQEVVLFHGTHPHNVEP